MKKLLAALLIAAAVIPFTLSADESCAVGFWVNSPKSLTSTDVDGLGIGLVICDIDELKGAELSIIGSIATTAKGFQFAWFGFNKADTFTGCQLAFVNLIESRAKTGVQVGFFNQSNKDGIQVGCINNCKDNALVQVGLININKNGLLPVMIFVNFAKDLFK